jgi:hypothetical protein
VRSYSSFILEIVDMSTSERVRRRRRSSLLRLENLWFVNAPARLVAAFEESLLLVSSPRTWGAIERDVCAVWAGVTLEAT